MDGGGDPERQQALESYKNRLLESREWEAKLKALRMDIKGLQKSFGTTEDNIKALQSVGQIIGEVLKQLDDERCMSQELPSSVLSNVCCVESSKLTHFTNSHRESLIGPALCGRLPLESRQIEAETGNSRRSRYDNSDNNAHAASRS